MQELRDPILGPLRTYIDLNPISFTLRYLFQLACISIRLQSIWRGCLQGIKGGLVRDGWCRRGSEPASASSAVVKVLMIRPPISSSPSPTILEAGFYCKMALTYISYWELIELVDNSALLLQMRVVDSMCIAVGDAARRVLIDKHPWKRTLDISICMWLSKKNTWICEWVNVCFKSTVLYGRTLGGMLITGVNHPVDLSLPPYLNRLLLYWPMYPLPSLSSSGLFMTSQLGSFLVVPQHQPPSRHHVALRITKKITLPNQTVGMHIIRIHYRLDVKFWRGKVIISSNSAFSAVANWNLGQPLLPHGHKLDACKNTTPRKASTPPRENIAHASQEDQIYFYFLIFSQKR